MKQCKKIILSLCIVMFVLLLSVATHSDVQKLQNTMANATSMSHVTNMQQFMPIKGSPFLYDPVFRLPQENSLIGMDKMALLKSIGKKALLLAGIISVTVYFVNKLIGFNAYNHQYNENYRNDATDWWSSIKNKCGSLLQKRPGISLKIRF